MQQCSLVNLLCLNPRGTGQNSLTPGILFFFFFLVSKFFYTFRTGSREAFICSGLCLSVLHNNLTQRLVHHKDTRASQQPSGLPLSRAPDTVPAHLRRRSTKKAHCAFRTMLKYFLSQGWPCIPEVLAPGSLRQGGSLSPES